jgi:hypothetical protein
MGQNVKILELSEGINLIFGLFCPTGLGETEGPLPNPY